MDVELTAQAIAKEAGGEVLRSRIEGEEIIVLLVDGRKIRRPLTPQADAQSAPPKPKSPSKKAN